MCIRVKMFKISNMFDANKKNTQRSFNYVDIDDCMCLVV